MRNFGINVTSPTTVGGNQSPGSHYDAGAHADSNVIQLFPSPPVAVDSADADFGALCFAIAAFWSPMVLVGVSLVIWFLFF